MIYCKCIQGTDYVFDISYRVTAWSQPACREFDAQPFAFEIASVMAALDEPNPIFYPATAWLQEQIEDDEQLAEEVEFDAYHWLVIDQDRELEADEERCNYSAA